MSAIDAFHEAIEGMADELGLDGDERDQYVGFHMEKKGYTRTTAWNPPEQQGGKQGGQGGGLFGGGGSGGGKTGAGQPKTYFAGRKAAGK
jgi:hypothetical protein